MDLELLSDEILLKNDYGFMDNKRGDLFLTNRRIVWQVKSTFGNKVKEQRELLLTNIKVHNGEPLVKKVGGAFEANIQIQHLNGISTISFDGRKKALSWLDEIHKALTGNAASKSAKEEDDYGIPGMDLFGKGIKDTVGSFKEGLGIGKSNKEENVSCNCVGCGAQISGIKGNKVTCEYCGTTQVL